MNQNINTMNPQFFMAMMNKFGQNNKQQLIFDPVRLGKKEKAVLMRQTAYQSKFGPYEKLAKFKHVLFAYCRDFPVSKPNHLCEVSVEYDHCLDVAEKYATRGFDYNVTSQMNPVVVNVVGRDFNGSNLEISEEMRDELINMRTTFNNTFDNYSQFPLKKDECTYLKIVNVIRPSYPHNSHPFIPLNDVFRIGLITIAPINTQTLLNGKTILDGKMLPNDLLNTLITIECIFQCAIWKQHPVLILPPFGNDEEDNNPVDDIIKIYNYCILKYGHMFKKIIVAVPKYYPKDVYIRYKKDIIKPIELVLDIDKKYEKEEVQKQILLQQKQGNFNFNQNKQTQQNFQQNQSKKPTKIMKVKKDQENDNQDQQFSQDQIDMFMKMMPTMMNMMQNKTN